jgi:hypothetical protein
MAFGVICAIAALLGFSAIKYSHRAFSVMNGVVMFPVWLVFIISGISLLAVTFASEDVMSQLCESKEDQPGVV